MRVLLDECLPRRLKQTLPGHDVRTVADVGWTGRKNGELLRLAAEQFDVFITVDRNIEYQQNVPSLAIGVVLLPAQSNDIDDLLPLMPKVRDLLPGVKTGELVRIGGG